MKEIVNAVALTRVRFQVLENFQVYDLDITDSINLLLLFVPFTEKVVRYESWMK